MQRDLACLDPWEDSLQRSRARRAASGAGGRRQAERPQVAARPVQTERLAVHRDLTDFELWEQSRRRARERHELAAARGPELPARELSVAALLAIAGVPVAGATVAKALSGGGGIARAGVTPSALVEQTKPVVQAEATAAPPVEPAASVSTPAAAGPRPAPKLAVPSATTTTAKAPAQASGGVQAVASTTKPRATTAATKTIRPAGGGVADLQRALDIPVDGDFGRKTEAALKRWQRAHDLHADGVLGAETRSALKIGSGPTLKRERPARRQKRSHRRAQARPAPRRGGGVSALQRALGIPADGVFGPATERALKRWQRRHGLAADGVAGPQTRAKLGLGKGPVLKRKHRGGRRGGGGGGGSSKVQQVIAAANRIATKPYRYGGGHGSWTDSGYDCSGSVSYALHGAGLLSSPLDSSGLMSYGRPGRGRYITVYAHGGHAFMVINGRRFDTSARSQTGSRWSSSMRSTAGYVARHPAGL